MYVPQVNTIFVEIPKTATRTVVHSAQDEYGVVSCPGHKPLSYVINWIDQRTPKVLTDLKVCAIYREPFERFLSAINYCSGKDPRFNIDKAVVALEKPDGRRDTVFNSQSYYMDFDNVYERYPRIDFDLKVFQMGQVDEACQYLGYTGEPLYSNKSKGTYTLDDIKNLRPLVEKVFRADYDLWYQERPVSSFL